MSASDESAGGRTVAAVVEERARPRPLLAELRRRNPVLFGVAVVHAVLFVAFLVGTVVDPRTIAGEPAWLKPAKFAGSIVLFTATLGWIGYHLPVSNRTLRRVSLGVGVAMVIEILLISGQAARGRRSHFNDSTAIDLVLYIVMGVTIVCATLFVCWLLVRSIGRPFSTATPFARGIQLGLALFVIGAFEGGAMIALNTHAVASGPAVPVLGWVLPGDFRLAHFVGLHALQVLPLVGYLAATASTAGRLERPTRLVVLVALGHFGVLLATFGRALVPVLS